MSKPWEETWQFSSEREVPRVVAESGTVAMGIYQDDPDTSPRLRLAACAPEAIRMLLAMEWAGVTIDGEDENVAVYRGACLACGNDSMLGHNPKCPWLALMRKAGVRE